MTASPATAGPSSDTAPLSALSETPQRILSEVELLMREGLRRIADVHTEMPQARHPLLEALELSEQQTMRTLEYVDSGRQAVEAIRNTRHGYIDEPLNRIAEAFSIILESQQGQDLAGQRLKKALTLMTAVQERIAAVLKEIPMEPPLTKNHSSKKTEKHADAPPAKSFAQDDVDALLTELGI
ncbi:MAG: hypothetical protein ACYCS8_18325 [Acidithiobacillus sp.]